MKLVIVRPDGKAREFGYSQFAEFHHCLFAVLAGIVKRVEIEIDKDFNVIYRINYA